MHIHDRYLGRELRCTSCRKAFVAEAPAEEPAFVPEPAEPTEPRDRRVLWVAAGISAAALLVLAAVVAWFGAPERSGVRPGRQGIVAGASGSEILATLERDDLDELERGDSEELVRSFRAVRLAAGTRFEVVQGGAPGAPIRIRPLTGPWTSKRVWVLPDWVELQ
jgi:hypothetical protein